MKIDLFGPPRLIVAGAERQHPSRKAMALLAYLATQAGAPVTRGHLATLLWPDADPDQARVNLRQCLSQLKSLLGAEAGAALRTAGDRVALGVAGFEIPSLALAADAPAGLAARIAAGPGFLEGFSARADGFDDWAAAQRHLLESRLADALEGSGRDRLAARDPAGAALDLALSLKLDPLRETAHRGLMQAQAALGRSAAALAQYEKCRAALKDQLGVEPDAETRALAAQIRAARLGRPQQPGAAGAALSEAIVGSAGVVVFAEAAQGGALVELHRGPAIAALEAALDSWRSAPAGATGAERSAARRMVAVAANDPSAIGRARATLALHAGDGIVVTPEVYLQFGDWSPFSFAPAPAAAVGGLDEYHLLLGEMPRHRLQVAPTTSHPELRPEMPEGVQSGKGAGNSVVVLPFRDHSPDAGRLNLGDVMAEEIIARLARFRLLKVAGPSAGQTCRALGLGGAELRDRLGVKYAVDGSVARIGERLVITYSITDLSEDRLIHGDRYEGRFTDLFTQQSAVIDRIASTLFNRTQEAEMDRLAARLTNDIGAYELYLSGLAAHRKGGLSTRNAHVAVGRFDEAIGIDPDFVRAHAYRLCAMSWYAPVEADGIGFRDIDRLVRLDDNDPEVHRIAGALHQIAGQSDLAVAHLDRAVHLNPSDAYLLASSAVYRAYAGDGAGALRQIERAMEVDPFLPAWCVEDHGVVLYANADYAAAAQSLRRLTSPSPRALCYLAAALVAWDDLAGARAAVGRIRHVDPDYALEGFMQLAAFRDAGTREGLRVRLAQAGLV